MTSSRMPVVAVTGASGFVGSALVTEALSRGVKVVALSRRGVQGGDSRVERPIVDLLDSTALSVALRGADAVVHAAGLAHVFDHRTSADAFRRANVLTTVAVAKAAAAAEVPRLVLLSSVAVYGSPKGGATEDAACNPSGPYARSKLEAELEAARLATETGTSLTTLRLATVYGEGDRGNIARLIAAIDRRRFIWIGRGVNRKSVIYRADAARAIVDAACGHTLAAGIFNLSAPAVTIRRIVEVIGRQLDRPSPRWHIPAGAARVIARAAAVAGRPALQVTVERWLAEDVYPADRFNTTFGFECRVDLETGLEREVRWYRAHPLVQES